MLLTEDSPLSTTASIIAILTFCYALLIGAYVYWRSLKYAQEDRLRTMMLLHNLKRDVDLRLDQISPLTPDGDDDRGGLEAEMNDPLRALSEGVIDIERMLFANRAPWEEVRFRERIRFAMNEQTIARKIAEAEKQEDALTKAIDR